MIVVKGKEIEEGQEQLPEEREMSRIELYLWKEQTKKVSKGNKGVKKTARETMYEGHK